MRDDLVSESANRRPYIEPPESLELPELDDLTYGEMEVFEEVVGAFPTDQDEVENLPKMKMLLAMALIAGQRTNPDITLADVRRWKLTSATIGDFEVKARSKTEPGPFD